MNSEGLPRGQTRMSRGRMLLRRCWETVHGISKVAVWKCGDVDKACAPNPSCRCRDDDGRLEHHQQRFFQFPLHGGRTGLFLPAEIVASVVSQMESDRSFIHGSRFSRTGAEIQ